MALIQNVGGSNTADVNSDGELLVALSKVLSKAGYAALVGELHDGAVGVSSKLRRSPAVSIEKKLASGLDSLLWDDVFNHSVQNVSRYAAFESTATKILNGGFLTLNTGNSIAFGAACVYRTWRTFPIFGNAPTIVDVWANLSALPVTNNVVQFGLGLPASAAPYSLSDGVYLEVDSAGALQLLANYNGTSTSSGALLFTFNANQIYHFEIVIHPDRAEIYIDGALYGSVTRPAAGPALSQCQSAPLFSRFHNSAATASAQKLNIARWAVTSGDLAHNRLWATVQGGMGLNCINAPDGAAAGMTGNIVNSTAPVSATLSNISNGYATLGGNFQFAPLASAETDYALFAYLVPAAQPAVPGKNFVLRGVRIETFNTGAAVATTPSLLNWYVGVGSTGVSLATSDSVSTGTRASRRLPLGVQSFPVGAAIGAAATPVDVNFDAPLIVEPGTYLHFILRMPVSTATASQIIRGMITPNGYWE